MKTKEDIIKEIDHLINILDEACAVDMEVTIRRLRELIGLL